MANGNIATRFKVGDTEIDLEQATAVRYDAAQSLSDTQKAQVRNNIGAYKLPDGGIPKSNLASGVQDSLGLADSALQAVPNTYRTAEEQDVIDAGKVNTTDYNPAGKTSSMTQSVGKDSDGKLWTAPSGGGSSALTDLEDVQISEPTQGQNLTYDSTLQKWKNASSSATVAWGGISGQLSNQSDLSEALDGKQDALPAVTNDRYLHTNATTGDLEWVAGTGGGTDLTLVHTTPTVSSNALVFTPANAREYGYVSVSAGFTLSFSISNTNEHYLLIYNSSSSAVTVAVNGNIIGDTAISVPATTYIELSVVKQTISSTDYYVVTYYTFE